MPIILAEVDTNGLRFERNRHRLGAGHRLFVAAQSLDSLGDPGRHLRLVLCDLLRPHSPPRRSEMMPRPR